MGIREILVLSHLITLSVGGVIGWLIKQRLNYAKIKNLEKQTVVYAGQNLEKMQIARDAYDKSIIKCSQEVKKLIHLLDATSETKQIRVIRDNFCSCLMSDAIPSYIKYVEWEFLLFEDDHAALENFVNECVLCELRRFRRWLLLVNHRKFLITFKFNPLLVDKASLKDFSKISAKIGPEIRLLLKKEIDGIIADCQKYSHNT